MLQLFPVQSSESTKTGVNLADDVLAAVAAEERPCPPDRPWVFTNMIASADGATQIGGLSSPLGSPADTEMLVAYRLVADAIVVGSTTARSEGYGVPRASNQQVAIRQQRGQNDLPILVVVSASLSLPTNLPMFSSPDYRPIIATVTTSPRERLQQLSRVADVVELGEHGVEVESLLQFLHQRGFKAVLSEGGPRLNGQLVQAGAIDEWNLTVAPLLAAGASYRPAISEDAAQPPSPMKLQRVWKSEDDLLFCRWTKEPPSPS